MKRDALKALGLEKEVIDQIMKLNGEDLKPLQEKIKENEASMDDLNKKLQTYDGVDVADLKKQLKDLKSKYDNDMLAKDKEYAKRTLFDTVKFSSASAKKAVMSEFDSKNLEYSEGKFLGFDDFISEMKKNDPAAFEDKKNNAGAPTYVPEPTKGGENKVSLNAALHEYYKN